MWALITSLPTAVGLQGMVPCWRGQLLLQPILPQVPSPEGWQGQYHHNPSDNRSFQPQLGSTTLRTSNNTHSLGGHHPPQHTHSVQVGHRAQWGTLRAATS